MEFLTQAATSSDRVYLRAIGFDLRDLDPDNLDFLNLSARRKLQNIAGYEPLIFQRYSSALGDVWLDGVRGKLASPPDFSLFDPRNQVFDLLGTAFVAGYSNLEVSPPRAKEQGGIKFSGRDFDRESSWRLSAIDAEGDLLAVVSLLSNSTHIPHETPVARMTIHTRDGRTIERELLAGRDTSEWAYERPEVRVNARHGMARVFDRYPVDVQPSYDACRYVAYVPLGEHIKLQQIEIKELIPGVPVSISKVTLVDEQSKTSTPLTGLTGRLSANEVSWLHDPLRWEKVYDRDEVLILKNKRALPRAWLVGSARVVSSDEALRQIRGESTDIFKPRETVLLESSIPELSSLPQSILQSGTSAEVTKFEPNSISIKTSCSTASILVASEINYPGWKATVDGHAAPIHTADYLLRALALPAGEHVVEMQYAAPGAFRGMLISICTIIVLGVMLLVSLYTRGARGES
jgi:hypothetical protein